MEINEADKIDLSDVAEIKKEPLASVLRGRMVIENSLTVLVRTDCWNDGERKREPRAGIKGRHIRSNTTIGGKEMRSIDQDIAEVLDGFEEEMLASIRAHPVSLDS